MKRWLGLLVFLAVALLLAWAGYQGYARLRALEARWPPWQTGFRFRNKP